MSAWIVFAWIVACLLGIGGVGLLIAADRSRYLSQFDFSHWRQRYYLSMLPNFLEALHNARLASPWPKRLNGLSAAIFRLKLRIVLRRTPTLVRRRFLQAHLNLYALLQILKPYIEDALLGEQVHMASHKLVELQSPIDREQLNWYIRRAAEVRSAFDHSLTPLDRRLYQEIVTRNFVGTLKILHAVFREHGYVLFSAIDDLGRWEQLSAKDLVHDLPKLAPSIQIPPYAQISVGSGKLAL